MAATTYRVHDAVDDVVDDLVDAARRALEDFDRQLTRLATHRATVERFLSSVRTPDDITPAPTAAPIVPIELDSVECSACGAQMTTRGLAIHWARKHKARKPSFDAQAARDAAADAL